MVVQKLARRLLAKKRKSLLQQDRPALKYFEDKWETITATKLSDKEKSLGTFTYTNGSVYSGDTWGGFKHGRGVQIWKDGAKYSGLWSYGEPYKHGVFEFPNGDVYEGSWSSCLMNG